MKPKAKKPLTSPNGRTPTPDGAESVTTAREPGYWPNEQTGVLAPVVMRYLQGEALDVREVGIMRAYVAQWVESPVWDMNPHHREDSRKNLADLRTRVREIKTRRDLDAAIDAAVIMGIDPL